ncbi:GNAT family N-acetyltransferase [Salinimicrobium flavum]|uniref:GNAT family N-acetyltransferase n=1 Tax=Salinimicrobium flavum TaxID=1737065 RepID=A0ABW5IW49_9FLAO
MITGKGIILRRVTNLDIPQLVDICFYDGEKAESVEQALTMQEKIDRDYEDGTSIHWGIEDLTSGRIVGTCGYYRGFKNASGELGCVLLPSFRGKGYMTKAMQLVMDFGFLDMGLEKVTAVTSTQNQAAIQLLEQLGFSKTEEKEEMIYAEFCRPAFSRKIRRFTSLDQKQVLTLLELNTPKYFHPSEEKDLITFFDRFAEHYFVVEEAGRIIACGGYNLGFEEGKAARLSWDIVHPAYHGKGVGRKLTAFRLDELKKHPEVKKVQVRTTREAHGFYQKTGFRLVSTVKDYWAGSFDLYLLELLLKN